MKDYIDEKWEEFVWDMNNLNVDPWLDTYDPNWIDTYIAYAWAYFIGESE